MKESEFKFKSVFHHVPVAIWDYDVSEVLEHIKQLKKEIDIDKIPQYLNNNPDYVIKLANSIKINDINGNVLNVFQANSEDEVKKSLLTTFSEKSIETFKELLFSIANSEKTFCKETQYKTLNNEIIDVMLKVSLPQDEENYKNVLVNMMDLSPVKKNEEKIRNIYNALCKSSTILILWNSENGININEATDNIYDLTGYLSSEFIKGEINGISILHPEDAVKVENDIIKLQKGKEKEIIKEYRIVTKSKQIKWVKDITIACYKDNKITHYQSIISDITEDKKSKDGILKNLTTFKNLIETIKIAYLVLDADGNILEVNKVFTEMIGNESTKIIGKNISELVSLENKSKIKKAIELLNKGIPIEDMEIDLDSHIFNKSGIWIRINANIMENGKKSIFCIIKDITDKKIEEFKKYINDQKHKDKLKQNITNIRNKIQNMNKKELI